MHSCNLVRYALANDFTGLALIHVPQLNLIIAERLYRRELFIGRIIRPKKLFFTVLQLHKIIVARTGHGILRIIPHHDVLFTINGLRVHHAVFNVLEHLCPPVHRAD